MLLAGGAMSFTDGPGPTAAEGGGLPAGSSALTGGAPAGGAAASSLGPGGISLPGGEDPGTPQSSANGLDDVPWSRALVTFGFSFFVGFAIGYAARAFLRISLVFLGVFLVGLFLFLLHSKGWVQIEWNAMEASFNAAMNTLGDEFSRFRNFITGSLPQTGMAGLGLWTGFRKH